MKTSLRAMVGIALLWPIAAAAQDVPPPAPPESENANPNARWTSSEDYPVSAIRAGAEGTARIGWTIGIDGRAKDCHVLSSSGNADLDKASCDAILLRARYSPALDQHGNPIESYSERRIRWKLPE
jgi:protein TonB